MEESTVKQRMMLVFQDEVTISISGIVYYPRGKPFFDRDPVVGDHYDVTGE